MSLDYEAVAQVFNDWASHTLKMVMVNGLLLMVKV